MAEIPLEKTINSTRHLIEDQDVEEFLKYDDAENFIEYRYAKNLLDHPMNSEGLRWSFAEMIANVYKTSRPEASFPSYLLDDSRKIKGAWDGLNLIAQNLLREGQPLPPELAEWVADVLADQLVAKKGQKRRPRPGRGLRRWFNRDLLLCLLVSQLICLFDLNATRNAGDPLLTACDVAAAAQGLSYKTVEKIWNNREPGMKSLFSSWDKQKLREGPFYPHSY